MIDVKGVIGNTPMIRIDYEKNCKQKSVYCKLEYYNLTGSIKDRVAYYIIVNAKLRGDLKDSMPIVEATSGNTGIALSALGAFFGHPVFIYMPEWVSKERIKIMKSFGASVYLVSEEQGGFKRCIEEANNKAKEVNGFLANQFSNYDNVLAHYETTGKEILDKLPKDVYGFVSGVGTGGTLMGTGKRLKENFKDIKIVAIEPDKMPIISQGKILGQHKIEGIGDEFVPDLLDKNFIDDVLLVNDDDAINMSRKLAKDLGIGVGISSGANFLGCVQLQESTDKPIVTVFADDNKKYLSTELANDVVLDDKFLSNEIKLLNYEFL